MKTPVICIVRTRAIILGTLALTIMMLHPGPLPAQTDACALLKTGDVAPLLGEHRRIRPVRKGRCVPGSGRMRGTS